MEVTAPPPPPKTTSNHRTKAFTFAAIIALACLISLSLALALTQRVSSRFDLSSVAGKPLADRTTKVLAQIAATASPAAPYRIIVASDFSQADPRAIQQLTDLLEEFRINSNQSLDYTLLDVTNQSGIRGYQDVLRSLTKEHEQLLTEQSTSLAQAAQSANQISRFTLGELNDALLEIQSLITAPATATPVEQQTAQNNKAYFAQTAAAIRIAGKDLETALPKVQSALNAKVLDIPLPRPDQAATALITPLESLTTQLTTLAGELKRYAEAFTGPSAQVALRVQPLILNQRDAAAIIIDRLKRLPRSDLLRVVDALGATSSGAIIIAPPPVAPGTTSGVSAVDTDALLPTIIAAGASMDSKRRAEEALTIGLASLANAVRPIVVLVHGEPREFLGQVPILSMAQRRLEMRGIDFIEWACVVNPTPTRLTQIDPNKKRPVVYLIMSADSASGSAQPQNAQNPTPALTGVARNEKIGATLAKLIEEGEQVLVSLNPSVVPSYGGIDPIVKPLAALGIAAESGRPLLRETQVASTPGARVLETDLAVLVREAQVAAHPLASALRGLPVAFAWPITLSQAARDEGPKVAFTPILTIEPDANMWLESQWLKLWQTPRDQRALLPDLPRFEAARDSNTPQNKDLGWVVASASERINPVTDKPQRAVVVGTNSWLIDQVVGRQINIDGRPVNAYPGNLELLDACVSYLAFQDDLIAQSAAAQPISLIMPIEPSRLLAIRLALILGLPTLVLLLGGAMLYLRR